jgi:hypothetical protein
MLTLYKPSFLCFLTFWRHITYVLFLPFLAEWIFSFLWLGLSGAHLTSHIVTSALSSWARTIEKFLTTRGKRSTVPFTTVRITTVRNTTVRVTNTQPFSNSFEGVHWVVRKSKGASYFCVFLNFQVQSFLMFYVRVHEDTTVRITS